MKKKNSVLSIFNGNLFNSLGNYCFQTFFRISKVLNRRPIQEFSKMWRRHHYRLRVTNFDRYWALTAISLSSGGCLACHTYCDTVTPL